MKRSIGYHGAHCLRQEKIGVVADTVAPSLWAYMKSHLSSFVYHCRKKTGSPQTIASDGSSQDGGSSSAAITPTGTPPTGTSCKDTWPSGSPSSQSPETVNGSRPERLTNGNKSKSKHKETSDSSDSNNGSNSSGNSSNNHRAPGHHRTKHNSGDSDQNRYARTIESVYGLFTRIESQPVTDIQPVIVLKL